jgi:alanine-glyoxylate transaminase/serine-glyoxylate transaminase/serine-pyruvate transaminase
MKLPYLRGQVKFDAIALISKANALKTLWTLLSYKGRILLRFSLSLHEWIVLDLYRMYWQRNFPARLVGSTKMRKKHMKLMIPGPIELENDVLEIMGEPVQAHYGDAWVAVHNETIGLLQQILGTTHKVFMMPGSGSLGNDAAVQSLFAPGSRVAVGINGNFGMRMAEILQANGVVTVPVEAEPNQPLDAAQFERVFAVDPSIVGAAVIHLETSTAVLNPIHEIAAVCHAYNRLSLIDVVSSLGGTEFHMDDWNIDLCVSASQKGLGAAPGLAIVAAGPRAWNTIVAQAERPRSWYLDLRRWQWYAENWGDWHPFPVTMPTSIILGLRTALRSLLREGLDMRIRHYEGLAAQLRSGLTSLGLNLFVPASLMSPVLTAVYCPPGISSAQIVKYLADEHQIKITAGFGLFKESVFRIGHMGGAITEADINSLLDALRQFLDERQRTTMSKQNDTAR